MYKSKTLRNLSISIVATFASIYASRALSAVLSAGRNHTCYWEDKLGPTPKCWSQKWLGFEDLVKPRGSFFEMASGALHTCMLFGDAGLNNSRKVECVASGEYAKDLLAVATEAFDIPLKLSSSQWHTCALVVSQNSGNAVRCWGLNTHQENLVPLSVQIGGPTSIYSGEGYTCAIHSFETLVSCWGKLQGEWPIQTLKGYSPNDVWFKNGREIADFSCLPTTGEPECWLNKHSLNQVQVRRINPYWDCEIDQKKTFCRPMGDEVASLVEYPELSGASDIALGKHHFCAIGQSGLQCIGPRQMIGSAFPTRDEGKQFGLSFQDLNDLTNFLNSLSRQVYKEDRNFLKYSVEELGEILASKSNERLLYFLQILRLYLSDFDYADLAAETIPAALKVIDNSLQHLTATLNQSLKDDSSEELKKMLARLFHELLVTGKERMNYRAAETVLPVSAKIYAHTLRSSSLPPDPEVLNKAQSSIDAVIKNHLYLGSRAKSLTKILDTLKSIQ